MHLFRDRPAVVVFALCFWVGIGASTTPHPSIQRSSCSREKQVMSKSTRSAAPPLQLTDLQSDPHNANRGTDRGRAALERSLREYGAGRPVLIDRDGHVIAGNKTVEQAKRLNMPLLV